MTDTMLVPTTATLVPTKNIQANPYQPRLSEDAAAIKELAESILRNGLMQKPKGRRVNSHVELVYGHSRVAAFRWLEQHGHPEFAEVPLEIEELNDQQMFEMGVSENSKRRQLKPMELARSMKAYMDTFGKSLKETGKFYGISAPTVQAKLELLDLSELAQEKLNAGEITENTAHLLLATQRVLPEKTLSKVLKGVSILDATKDPDNEIESALRYDENVEHMSWNNEAKPRAGRDGWLLDMQNFPNTLLPELTEVDVATVLHIEKNKDLLARIHTAFEAFQAEPLGVSLVERLKEVLDAGQLEKVQHLVNPPACNVCPFYVATKGGHFCGMKFCFARKHQAWAQQELKHASGTTGIPVYKEAEDGPYAVLEGAYYSGPSIKLFEAKNKDLRLILKQDLTTNTYQSGYKGVGESVAIIAVGEARKKVAAKNTSGDNRYTPEARQAQKRKKIYNLHRKELTWEFTDAGKVMFAALTLPALKNLNGWTYLQKDLHPLEEEPADNAKTDIKTEYYRRLMVWCLIQRESYSGRPAEGSLVKWAEYLEKLAKEWGFKYPKALTKLAETGDAEIEAVELPAAKAKK